ncbi:matrix metalloproteinase-24 [Eurytemora carolleeae]|uniref:matrix metalloproteinase-24 n=1 Tax=Eurytemora carolleeae TaxID=1294199 RepID=UPI000C7954AC|nr:matrix metalloproteinase-24 [Eurytemora carolleeae]|eukprot:XP_023326173.1 matrix metalloproteinase-24-like [Eurytemora affinis]
MKYGYLQGNVNSSTDGLNKYMKSAVQDFQTFAGLEPTGVLDPVTVELMETPRCGVKDIIGHGATARRRKRYVLQGSKWRVNDLTYRISQYPSTNRLSKQEIDLQFKQAFQLWEDVTSLRFQLRDSDPVHIDIKFVKGEHGDGDPFDGPGGTLAHAYFPQYGGDMHVDDTEYWTIDSFKGTNLLQTVVHELGHSLGLSHSDVRDSIMAPFYTGWTPNLKLSKDDIQAIQALYGPNVNEAKPTPPPTTKPPVPIQPGGSGQPEPGSGGSGDTSLCEDASIDTIFKTKDGSSYVFKGQNYWKLTDTSVADGYPRLISQDWAGLPDNLDAAFTWDSGATYFFKGGEYWKFENMVPSSNYPKPLSKGFPDIPSDIDAAFVWGGNGKIYFFKDNNYWKFDPDRTPHVQSGKYPRSLSLWGLPSNVEGSIQWDNGKTYFFKKGQYWRFNDLRFGIDRGNPPFPRNTGEWWFGCPKVRPLIDENAGVNLPGVNLPVVQAVEDGGDVAVRIDLLNEEYSNTAGDEDLDAF